MNSSLQYIIILLKWLLTWWELNFLNQSNMETYFPFADQIEPPEIQDSLGSQWEVAVNAIIQWVPDPRLLPDNQD